VLAVPSCEGRANKFSSPGNLSFIGVLHFRN
jgi:hypothetical protein